MKKRIAVFTFVILLLSPVFLAARTVLIEDGAMAVDGTPVFPFGGEVQYFRVRDQNFDPAETWRMWEETLDLMAAAGMNYVTTYIPWDYHEIEEGVFDFGNCRDLDRFLDMCYRKDFLVGVRPGPYINAEWPAGYPSFGAIPEWLKENYPETLCVTRLGLRYGQPTYLHPDFLSCVENWFARIAPTIRKYIYEKPCIVTMQLDNEPAFFFENKYKIDYSDTMIDYYRGYLRDKFGAISGLNRVYRCCYSSFEDVDPPTAAPVFPKWNREGKNCRHWDWHDASDRYIMDYLFELRRMWEDLGIAEPGILFTTNDPFGCYPFISGHLHNGPRKNLPGLAAVDFYPKMFPFVPDLMDYPYMADFATKLFGFYNRFYGVRDFVMGAEIQGGWFMKPTRVKPEETAHVLTKAVGHGMKAVGIYVIRDGYNLNGSIYDFDAAIGLDGGVTDRYRVLEGFGKRVLGECGDELLRSVEVEDDAAILVYWPHLYPQGGILDEMQNLSTWEQGALLGMLKNAGYNPAILDLHEVNLDELLNYRALFFLNPDYIDGADAKKLLDYVETGGTLVNFLWEGKHDLRWFKTEDNRRLKNKLFPGDFLYSWVWSWGGLWPLGDEVRYEFGAEQGFMHADWNMSAWSLLFHPGCEPFLFDRNTCLPVAYRRSFGAGNSFFIGTHLQSQYNRGGYYNLDEDDLNAKEKLVDWMMSYAGVTKAVDANGVREEAWARMIPGEETAFLFLVNNHESGIIHLDLNDTDRLGLTPGGNYTVENLVSGVNLGDFTGEELRNDGIDINLPTYGVAVVRISIMAPGAP